MTSILITQTSFSLADEKNNINYKVKIYVVEQKEHAEVNPEKDNIKTLINKLESTINERSYIPENDLNYIYYHFDQEKSYIEDSLHSYGYYKSKVSFDINEKEQKAIFSIIPSTRYTFGKVSILVDNKEDKNKDTLNIPTIEKLKDSMSAQEGDAAIAHKVISDEEIISKWTQKNNCLFDFKIFHEAIVDNTSDKVNIDYHVIMGRQAKFANIEFNGSKTISDSYLHKIIPDLQNKCFKKSEVNNIKLALRKSSLIEDSEIILPQSPNIDGGVPVTIKIKEKTHRSLKASAKYATDSGIGLSGGWEHRNFLSNGEKLSTELNLSMLESGISGKFEKNFFLQDNQKLNIDTTLKKQDNDAFESTGFTIKAAVERKLENGWKIGAGVGYGFEQITDNDSTENTALFSIPLFASKDKRDNILNPTKGWTFNIHATPFFDTINSSSYFIKDEINTTYYKSFNLLASPVFAARFAAGNIWGASIENIPATERFYRGGGGSIRGYEYNTVSPLDSDNLPTGGRSFIEGGMELRFRVMEDYGFVTFIDGGNAYDKAIPDFDEELLFSGGFGLRYYTDFAPIRADIAFPLNGRDIDNSFQVYFSIGQAF
ncbi:MAG: BamA/TamA family outer membrane protein [Rickettsiales bacterium]